MAFVFSQKGATPSPFSGASPVSPFMSGSSVSPFSNALAKKVAPNTGTGTYGAPMSVGQPTPKPATPVKKTTTNNVDGSSTTTEYHAPDVSTGGMSIPEYQAAVAAKNPPKVQSGVIESPKGSSTKAQTESSATQQSQPLSYPGLIGSLASNAQAQSPMAATAGKGLLKAPNQNSELGQRAEDIRTEFGGKIGEIGRLGAGATAGDLSTGSNVVGSGNAAIASQSASSRMQALAADEGQQLAAIDRQLSAQGQGQDALVSAGSLGNTAQGQLQSGLTSAAGFAQPQVSAVGQTSFNPLNAEFAGGAGGISPDIMQQYAQMAATGQVSAIPSTITSNPVLNAQLNAAAKAINPNYNPILSAAQGSAQASNLQSQTTASTEANQAVYQQGLGDLYKIGSQLQNVDELGNMLLKTAKGGEVNPFEPTFANQTIAAFKSQLSNPDQIRFNSNLATFQAAAQALLASGGGSTPTDVGNKINGIANGTLSLGALKALVDQAKQEGQVRYNSQKAIVDGAFGALNSGGNTNSNANSNQSLTWENLAD